ncbi:hypothetical protein [Phenylobacterium sp.]|jgi:type II secretory pathway component PulM|uniref:hypothetical protein n=1 Tax=Phenylobacterium sp. TaxID=1871053 RepID=UPI002F3E5722
MTLEPRIRWFGLIGAVVILVGVSMLWTWDPFHRRRHAEQRAAASADLAASASLEVQGARAALARTEAAVQRRDAANQVTASIQTLALQSKDANAPLSPDRAGRLRDHDRELCRIDPTLSGCAATR